MVLQVPSGENLTFGDENFIEMEKRGVVEARKAAFVLVAGGLGERLGYNGIKVNIWRIVSLTGHIYKIYCFLQLVHSSNSTSYSLIHPFRALVLYGMLSINIAMWYKTLRNIKVYLTLKDIPLDILDSNYESILLGGTSKGDNYRDLLFAALH